VLRARRYRAQILLQAGRVAEALPELRALDELHRKQSIAPVERGLLLDTLGDAEAKAGNGEKSQNAYRDAAGELAKQLPEDHPYRARNASMRSGS
jgi:hypothetical protein